MVAIIPAAGRGTRMEQVTGGAPKELLKLGKKSVLERVLEEAQLCEPAEMIVVASPSKPQLSAAAAALGARVELQVVPAGLADAIAAADTEDDAVILFGDCAYHGSSPATRISELIRKGIEGCIAVEQTDDAGTMLYGILDVDEFTGAVRQILEKPGPAATSSRWAFAARFGCSVRLMAFISEFVRNNPPPEGRELQLTPVLQAAIECGFDIKAVPLQKGQQRVDCGSPEEYRQAQTLDWDSEFERVY